MEGIEMEEMGGGCCGGNAGGDGRAMTGDGNTLKIECGERNRRLKEKNKIK
jgi:hypothetical protein